MPVLTMWGVASRLSSLALLILCIASSAANAQISRSAVAYMDRGNDSYARGDLDAAISDYYIAIAFEPRRPELRVFDHRQ